MKFIEKIKEQARTIQNKDNMYVLDIHRSKIETADIKITYKIRITNTGEIKGTVGEIIEMIPTGYSYYQEDNTIYWEERTESGSSINTAKTLVTESLAKKEINPGEYEEIEIVLRWNRGEDNLGEKTNIILINGEENPAGFIDINREDNQSTSNMIITVATGLDRNGRFILNVALQILIVVAVGLLIVRNKRGKNSKMR